MEIFKYENGEKPMSKWNNDEITNQLEKVIDDKEIINELKKMELYLLRDFFLENTSYHYTSDYNNPTYFYSIKQKMIDIVLENKADALMSFKRINESNEKETKKRKIKFEIGNEYTICKIKVLKYLKDANEPYWAKSYVVVIGNWAFFNDHLKRKPIYSKKAKIYLTIKKDKCPPKIIQRANAIIEKYESKFNVKLKESSIVSIKEFEKYNKYNEGEVVKMNYEQFKETEKYKEMKESFSDESTIENIFETFGEDVLTWSVNQIRFAEKVNESDLDLNDVMDTYKDDYYIDDNDISWLEFADKNGIDYSEMKESLDDNQLKDFNRCDFEELELIEYAFRNNYTSLDVIGNSDYPKDVKEVLIKYDVDANDLPEHELKECTSKNIELYAIAEEKSKLELLFPDLNFNDMNLERDNESIDILIDALKKSEKELKQVLM